METKNQKKVVIFGTFDLLHDGHKHVIQEAKKEGDLLFVVVGTDKNVEKIKGRLPHNNQEERMHAVKDSGLADKVLLGNEDMESCSMIEELKPDVICLGYDQKVPEKFEEKIKAIEKDVKIVKIDSHQPHIHKSSIIRKNLK